MKICSFFVCMLLLGNVYGQQDADIVFSNPAIINIQNGTYSLHHDILVKGNTITAIVTHQNSYSSKTIVVDATNKFIIPGLWDMHMHFGGGDSLLEENKNLLPLFIANGITAVRDASADISPAVLQWRAETASGHLFGPTIFTSGPKLEGLHSIWIGDLEVGTVEEMKKAMDSLQQLQVDFIKITDNTIKKEVYLEAIKEARKRGFKISGHIPNAVTMKEVTEAGLSSVEHMAYVLKAGAKNEASIATDAFLGIITPKDVLPLVMKNFDTSYAMDVYRKMAANGVAVTPTLNISRTVTYLDEENHWKDDYLKYLGQGLKNTYWWRVKRAAGDTKDAIAFRHDVFEKSAGLIPLLRDAGVTILAGTDAGYLNSFDYPGQSLHTELALLVKYGLTPLQALQASIINGPKFFNKEQQYGKIEKGYFADFILLDADPLTDISNTQKINGVVTKGRYLSRPALNKLLLQIKAKAAASPFKSIE